ncbi:MAG: 4-alpha-glucanotransferase [Alphaproteobacteria bacterium]
MDQTEALSRLADLVGIEPVFWDIFGKRNEASLETKQALMTGMGLRIETEAAVDERLKAFEERTWLRRLPPVTVLRRGRPLEVTLALPAEAAAGSVAWSVVTESGTTVEGVAAPGTLPVEQSREVGGRLVHRVRLPLPDHLPDGYHTLRLAEGGPEGKSEERGMLIIAPARCYLPDWFDGGERRWGVACHVYSLRSGTDWGMGDFSSLGALAGSLQGLGVASVGVNPLHALFPHNPLHASPYSPSSRLFLNPLYIDVTAIPEFAECDKAQKRVATVKFKKRLDKARDSAMVDYPAVAALKSEVLELLHAWFEAKHPAGAKASPRRQSYERFVTTHGDPLVRFAVYQALTDAHEGRTWRAWPRELQHHDSPEVAAFAQANASRVSYHLYLQWEADRQLGEAAAACTANGMGLGLYRDLAVGVDPQGADVWCNQAAFAAAHVGAPPDQFNAKGQDWGTPPFNPVRLQETAYADFIAVLRANMRHAGALRIDHVMALKHLFWIPFNTDPLHGAYVVYPFDDLLGIVALESSRNRCMVIGEDLGTVPDGFRERMTAEAILSYRVLFFERYPDGLFFRPGIYPPRALATASTHDLPTIAGHWMAADVALKLELGLVSEDQPERVLIEQRIKDRGLLAAALVDQGLIPDTFPAGPDLTDEAMKQLILAVHRFLARGTSQFMLVNLDDLLMEIRQLNLPGTVDEYPNWKRKLSIPVEEFAANAYLRESAVTIDADRRALPAPP